MKVLAVLAVSKEDSDHVWDILQDAEELTPRLQEEAPGGEWIMLVEGSTIEKVLQVLGDYGSAIVYYTPKEVKK